MPCGQARRTWTAGTLVVDARGAFWHLLDPDAIVDFGGLEPGRYTVRVRVVDAAGNRDPAPPRAAYVIGGSSGRRVASQVGAAGSTP